MRCSIKRKSVLSILAVLISICLLWIYMLGKTFHPVLSTKFLVKEDIISMLEEERENRVVHLVKAEDKLIMLHYERIGWFLYQYGAMSSRSFFDYEEILVHHFSVSTMDDYFIYGFCRRKNIKKIVFTFPDETQLEVIPNEEGIFLQLSKYEPLDAEQILGYTDTGEIIDILEYILN